MINRSITPFTTIPSALPDFHFGKKFLANGVLLIEGQDEEELVRLSLDFASGSLYETQNGLSGSLAKLLLSGSGKYSAFAIQETLDQYGAFTDIENSYEYISVTVFCLRKHLSAVLGFLQEVLMDVQIPKEEFALNQSRAIENLKVNEQKTSFIARRLFRADLFGAEHPYGRSVQQEDYLAITLEACQKYYQENFTSSLKRVLVNTPLNTEEQEIIGRFHAYAGNRPDFPIEKNAESSRTNRPFPGAVQASMMLGMPCISRKDPEYPCWSLMVTLFGGYFGSRLMKNIREDKGYTYGISAGVHHLPDRSYLGISAEVKNEVKNECVEEIFHEINRLRSSVVSEEELLTVKNYMLGSLQRNFDGSLALGDRYRILQDFDLKNDYYRNYVEQLLKLTSKDVLEIAVKYLDASKLHVVIVGEFSEE